MFTAVNSNPNASESISGNSAFNFPSAPVSSLDTNNYGQRRPSLLSGTSPTSSFFNSSMISSNYTFPHGSNKQASLESPVSYSNPIPSLTWLSLDGDSPDSLVSTPTAPSANHHGNPFPNGKQSIKAMPSLVNLQEDSVISKFPNSLEVPFRKRSESTSSSLSGLHSDLRPLKTELYGQLNSECGARFPQTLKSPLTPIGGDSARTVSASTARTSDKFFPRHTRAHSDFWIPATSKPSRHASHSSIGDLTTITQSSISSGSGSFKPSWDGSFDSSLMAHQSYGTSPAFANGNSPTLKNDSSFFGSASVRPTVSPIGTSFRQSLPDISAFGIPKTETNPSEVVAPGTIPISVLPTSNFSAATPANPSLINQNGQEFLQQSRVLYLFHANKQRHFELSDILGNVVLFSTDQHGSRFIQQKLATATEEEREAVFQEIASTSCLQLMMDIFGNYVVQKYFEFGNEKQKQILLSQIKGHVFSLSLQMYGCRVVQKAIEYISPEHQVQLIQELDGHVLDCVCDQNGNHVIQKAIECIDTGHLQFILRALRPQIHVLSAHPYGCRVIQRAIEHCHSERKLIIEELLPHILKLTQDQYGNYVVQHILRTGSESDKKYIFDLMIDHLLFLSCHKFASNVVERCISYISDVDRRRILNKIISEKAEK